jgi:septal ring factor EnvC (AmiA/AmiB activator)
VDAGTYFLSRRDNRSRTEEMLRSLRQCYFDVRRAAVGKELKTQETQLKDLEAKQKKLNKDNEDMRRSIEAWESKIQKAKQDIANNEQAQEANLVDQENQQRLVEETRRRLENVENEGGN